GHRTAAPTALPLEPPRHVECLISSQRLAKHDHVVLGSDDIPQAPANDGVIVCDQNSHHGCPQRHAPLALRPRRRAVARGRRGAQIFGSATVTLVPSPRTPVISTLP